MWWYLYATLGYLGLIVFRATLSAFGSLRASEQTHRLMLSRVLNAPIHWFDSTPLGRVLNRFSSDLAAVDTEVMDELYSMVDAGTQLFAVFAVSQRIRRPIVPVCCVTVVDCSGLLWIVSC